jgi:hypothetical protein
MACRHGYGGPLVCRNSFAATSCVGLGQQAGCLKLRSVVFGTRLAAVHVSNWPIVFSNSEFEVKLSLIVLARPTVLSAVGTCHPHSGVRRRWWINVASAVSSIESSQKIGRPHHRHRPGWDVFSRLCGNRGSMFVTRQLGAALLLCALLVSRISSYDISSILL